MKNFNFFTFPVQRSEKLFREDKTEQLSDAYTPRQAKQQRCLCP